MCVCTPGWYKIRPKVSRFTSWCFFISFRSKCNFIVPVKAHAASPVATCLLVDEFFPEHRHKYQYRVQDNEPIQIGRGGRDSVFKRQPLFVDKHHVRRTYYYYCYYNNYGVSTLYRNNEMNNSRYCIVRAGTYIGRNNTHAGFEYYTKRCKLLCIVTTTDNNKRKKNTNAALYYHNKPMPVIR